MTVRVIGLNSESLGVMTLREALNVARRYQTDLIEINPHSTPSVCRLIDVGKFKYQLQKKQQKDKHRQKSSQVKEVKLTPNIGREDYATKLRRMLDFISKGSQVKVIVRFRGREACHKSIGLELLERVSNDLARQESVEFVKKEEERNISILVSLNRKSKPSNQLQ